MSNFKNIILTIFVFFASATSGFAQNRFDALYEFYEKHNYTELQKQIGFQKSLSGSSFELQFFEALFTKNGEESKEQFQRVFDNGNDKIKVLAAKKLMDYYYAKGYYVNAAKYHKYLIDKGNGKIPEDTVKPPADEVKTDPKIVENDEIRSEVSGEKYFVQIGAFSLQENAEQLKKMLATQNINAKIVERAVEQKKLHCVWLTGKENFEGTLKYANEIKEKYDLKFRIIKQ